MELNWNVPSDLPERLFILLCLAVVWSILLRELLPCAAWSQTALTHGVMEKADYWLAFFIRAKWDWLHCKRSAPKDPKHLTALVITMVTTGVTKLARVETLKLPSPTCEHHVRHCVVMSNSFFSTSVDSEPFLCSVFFYPAPRPKSSIWNVAVVVMVIGPST